MFDTLFCPYDGKSITPNGLAYELVFSDGWTWERVKKETPVGDARRLYVSENDSRRKHYSADAAFDGPVILLENRSTGGRNGIRLFLDSLDGTGQIYSSTADGVYIFYDQTDAVIMKAVPCCPHCHRRLPEGWLTCDDRIGIAVIAPDGSGKTAFIDSLIHNGCEAFKGITAVNGLSLIFAGAPESMEGTVFIRAELAGGTRSLMAGIYDASKYLTADGRLKRGIPDSEIMQRMDADLYLFDIRQMGISGIDTQKIAGRTVYNTCRMMSLEEQAEFQRKNSGKVIHAAELLKARRSSDKTKDKHIETDRFYENFTEERNKSGFSRQRDMQFAGVINKIDLLESREKKGMFAALFDRDRNYDMTDVNLMAARIMLSQELMNRYNMLPELRECGNAYSKGASWHCVSAFGCDALDDGTLTGEYRPIRTAEPVVMIIMRRFAENEWI